MWSYTGNLSFWRYLSIPIDIIPWLNWLKIMTGTLKPDEKLYIMKMVKDIDPDTVATVLNKIDIGEDYNVPQKKYIKALIYIYHQSSVLNNLNPDLKEKVAMFYADDPDKYAGDLIRNLIVDAKISFNSNKSLSSIEGYTSNNFKKAVDEFMQQGITKKPKNKL